MKKLFSFLALLAVAGIASFIFPGSVQADFVEGSCLLDQPGAPGQLNCVSNDIDVANAHATVVDGDGCAFPGDTATISLSADIIINSQTRYDIGVWVATDGDVTTDGAQHGACAAATLPIPPADDEDSDACGDLVQGNSLSGVSLGEVTVVCNDTDQDGFINIPIITAWNNKGSKVNSPDCSDPMDALPGTNAKCQIQNELSLPVPVPGQIIVEKETTPDGSSEDFNFQVTDQNTLDSFTLSDGERWESGTGGEAALFEGIYTVTETTLPDGWSLNNINCDTGSRSVSGSSVEIDLQAGEVVTCTYTNVRDPFCGDGNVDSGEECDDGNNDNGDGCNSECKLEIAGACGSLNGTGVYDFDNGGDALTDANSSLCDTGDVVSFTYNNNTWSWECTGQGGAANASCAADELYCGDGVANGAEECDDGNGINNDECNNSCKNTIPGICGAKDGETLRGEDVLNESSSELCQQGIVINFDGPDGNGNYSRECEGTQGGDNASCSAEESWCGDGNVDTDAGETCDDGVDNGTPDNCNNSCDGTTPASCGNGVKEGDEQCDDGEDNSNETPDACRTDCTLPVCGDEVIDDGEQCDDGNDVEDDGCNSSCEDTFNGICGTADSTEIYFSGNNGGDLSVESAGLCEQGTAANFNYDNATHSWSWDCLGSDNGGSDVSCSADETYCGDEVTQESEGEACDDGANGDPNDGCTDQCVATTNGVCSELDETTIYDLDNGGDAVGSGDILCDEGTAVEFTYDTELHVWNWLCQGDGGSSESCTVTETYCGDDVVNGEETCDDGVDNGTPGSCNSTCSGTVPVTCGDGFVNEGEQCDDGNDINNDSCTNDCTTPVCGDNIVQSGEQCDDGNTQSGDGCSASCTEESGGGGGGGGNFCGDGIVRGGEQCDDGNYVDGDGCSSNCEIEEDEEDDTPPPVDEEEDDGGFTELLETGDEPESSVREQLTVELAPGEETVTLPTMLFDTGAEAAATNSKKNVLLVVILTLFGLVGLSSLYYKRKVK